MLEELGKPQVEETQEITLPGEEIPQVAELTEEPTHGAETEPQKEPEPKVERKYTQAEWSEREAAKDREIAQHRQAMTQLYMQQQIAQAQAAEAQAQATDRQAVDEGEITASEAAQRQQQRQQAVQQQQVQRQQMAAAQQVMAQAEQAGRILAAQDFSKQYEIDATELLSDKSLTSPAMMEAKAAKLALEKTRGELKAAKTGPETFDSGQVGSVGVSIASMSPEEKISWALNHPPRRKT